MAKKKIPSPEEISRMPETLRMKYEIADELGLMDRVRKNGWGNLTARETGRIGGLVSRKKREEKTEKP